MADYIVVTHIQNPNTGGLDTRVLQVGPKTTIGEIVDWYKDQWNFPVPVNDLSIVEADHA